MQTVQMISPLNIINNDVNQDIEANYDSIKDQENCCIICFGEENIVNNDLCNCNFKYHKECYIDWLKKSSEPLCIICSNQIDTTTLGISLQVRPDSEEENTDEIVEPENITFKDRLFYIIQNTTVPLETLSPNDLLINVIGILGDELPNDIESYRWRIIDENYNIKKVSLTYIPERALIYYCYTNNGNFVSNLELTPRSQRRIIRYLTNEFNNDIDIDIDSNEEIYTTRNRCSNGAIFIFVSIAVTTIILTIIIIFTIAK